MAVRAVLVLPHPALTRPAVAVGVPDDDARSIALDLLETMAASPACVGLAAPQIGVGRRVCVVDVAGHPKARSRHGPIVLFDPEITAAGPLVTAREGCMSVPDLTGDVARPQWLELSATGFDGEPVELRVDAFEARAVCHELDHLDGLLFLDKVAGPHAVFPRKVYR